MERSIYKYVLKHTLKDQILLIVLTAISMPFIYYSLEIPKIIINEAIGGANIPDTVFGYPVDQIKYLLLLSLLFLGLIFINGAFKYVINVYRGVLGERMLRRFRYELYNRLLRFPLPHFKRVSQGEIIPMITVETEPLGGFIGDAFALPAFQGGLLLTYLFFIFNQDIWLGLAAIALYPPQLYIIPKLQRKVNELAKRRVQTVRQFSDRVGESISGITEIHAHDTSHYERARVADRLGLIYKIRFELYRRKFFIKFLNNFLAQLTPFFFYSIGGYLVITGKLSLGALVAVLAAYKDISPPWKELLKYYQTKEDIRVKYQQIIEQFDPENMFDAKLQDTRPEQIKPLEGELITSAVRYSEDRVTDVVDGVNLRFNIGDHVAVVGLTGSGKDELSQLIARLLQPTSGRITLGESNLAELPEAITGQRIAYLGPTTHIFSGTLADNLFYSLKHQPYSEAEYNAAERQERERDIKNAKASGNTTDDVRAQWVDYNSINAGDESELFKLAIDVLSICGLEKDVFDFGLAGKPDLQDNNQALCDGLLEARRKLHSQLRQPELTSLVEFFDRDRYIVNMSVAENLLFGAPLDDSFSSEKLSANQLVGEVLKKTDAYEDLLHVGKQVAEIMLDLFTGVSPDSELFEQYSFIDADDLPVFPSLLSRIKDENWDSVNEDDRGRLLALSFKLIPTQHRLGLIDEVIKTKLIKARHLLEERLVGRKDAISFFHADSINPAVSLQDNILFGRLAYGRAHGRIQVAQLIRETVHDLGLDEAIIKLGMEYEVGIGGSRLSMAQRQRLSIARCLLKRPDLLIVNEAISALDPKGQTEMLEKLIQYCNGRSLFWVLTRPEYSKYFDKIVVLEHGKLTGYGSYDELTQNNAVFTQMLGTR